MSVGSGAFVLSRIVCSTKKSSTEMPYQLLRCKQCRLYKAEEWMWYDLKCSSVFHQSHGPVSVVLSIAAKVSIKDCLVAWISAVVILRVCLYFSKSAGLDHIAKCVKLILG